MQHPQGVRRIRKAAKPPTAAQRKARKEEPFKSDKHPPVFRGITIRVAKTFRKRHAETRRAEGHTVCTVLSQNTPGEAPGQRLFLVPGAALIDFL